MKKSKKKTTKIIEVNGDDDYNVVVFEDNIDASEHLRIWTDAMKSNDHTLYLELDGQTVHVTAHEFRSVPKKFMEFVRDFQDYDGAKCHDWFSIEESSDAREKEPNPG